MEPATFQHFLRIVFVLLELHEAGRIPVLATNSPVAATVTHSVLYSGRGREGCGGEGRGREWVQRCRGSPSLTADVVEGGWATAGVPGEPLLPCRVLDVQLLDLVRCDGSDADERVLEVGANLPGCLTVSPLELTAKSLVDVALRAHHALLTVLLAAVGRRPALAALADLLGADQAGLAVVVPSAELALAQAVREHARAGHSLDVDAHGPRAAVLVGGALAAVARLRLGLCQLLVDVRGVLLL